MTATTEKLIATAYRDKAGKLDYYGEQARELLIDGVWCEWMNGKWLYGWEIKLNKEVEN